MIPHFILSTSPHPVLNQSFSGWNVCRLLCVGNTSEDFCMEQVPSRDTVLEKPVWDTHYRIWQTPFIIELPLNVAKNSNYSSQKEGAGEHHQQEQSLLADEPEGGFPCLGQTTLPRSGYGLSQGKAFSFCWQCSRHFPPIVKSKRKAELWFKKNSLCFSFPNTAAEHAPKPSHTQPQALLCESLQLPPDDVIRWSRHSVP